MAGYANIPSACKAPLSPAALLQRRSISRAFHRRSTLDKMVLLSHCFMQWA